MLPRDDNALFCGTGVPWSQVRCGALWADTRKNWTLRHVRTNLFCCRSTKYTHYGGQFRAAVVATSPKLSRSPSSPSSTASQSSDNSRFNLDNVTTPWGTMGSWRKSTKSTCRPSVGACLPNSDQPPNTLFYNCWSIPADNNVSSANTR